LVPFHPQQPKNKTKKKNETIQVASVAKVVASLLSRLLTGFGRKALSYLYYVACYLLILTSKGTNLHPRRRIPLNAETPILIN
jgi:hypothetical protein